MKSEIKTKELQILGLIKERGGVMREGRLDDELDIYSKGRMYYPNWPAYKCMKAAGGRMCSLPGSSIPVFQKYSKGAIAYDLCAGLNILPSLLLLENGAKRVHIADYSSFWSEKDVDTKEALDTIFMFTCVCMHICKKHSREELCEPGNLKFDRLYTRISKTLGAVLESEDDYEEILDVLLARKKGKEFFIEELLNYSGPVSISRHIKEQEDHIKKCPKKQCVDNLTELKRRKEHLWKSAAKQRWDIISGFCSGMGFYTTEMDTVDHLERMGKSIKELDMLNKRYRIDFLVSNKGYSQFETYSFNKIIEYKEAHTEKELLKVLKRIIEKDGKIFFIETPTKEVLKAIRGLGKVGKVLKTSPKTGGFVRGYDHGNVSARISVKGGFERVQDDYYGNKWLEWVLIGKK